MVSFENDYSAGAHPAILARLSETNLEPAAGYGSDRFTAHAAELIREACACPDAGIYLTCGGTQTNQLVISALLKDYEGVVSAATGHVANHEAGAIEYSGHKVLTIPSHEGKVDAAEFEALLDTFYADESFEHMVFPGMLYISQPTEYGTLYSREELVHLSAICRSRNIPLYMDGARLIYALAAPDNDLTLPDIAALTDVFYIGGTKAGALCGEAIVFTQNNMPAHFLALAKQRGALMAKGRLNGIQFETLFTDGLWQEIGSHAIRQKDRLITILKEAGLPFFLNSPTNQQFVIMEDRALGRLREKVDVSFWEKYDAAHTVVRFATSWATSDEDLAFLRSCLLS